MRETVTNSTCNLTPSFQTTEPKDLVDRSVLLNNYGSAPSTFCLSLGGPVHWWKEEVANRAVWGHRQDEKRTPSLVPASVGGITLEIWLVMFLQALIHAMIVILAATHASYLYPCRCMIPNRPTPLASIVCWTALQAVSRSVCLLEESRIWVWLRCSLRHTVARPYCVLT